jgi:hypothetical protein
MSVVGTVESLWRYPVKSMRGEESDEFFAGFAGVYGDRLFAFESSASSKGFPFFTGRDQRQMIRYRPRFRDPKKAAQPINRAEAEQSNASPISAKPGELMIDVETPDGKTFAIDDPALIDHLRSGIDAKHKLILLRSDKAITDCRPSLSLRCNRQENSAKKPASTSTSGAFGQMFTWIYNPRKVLRKTNLSAVPCASGQKLSCQFWSVIRAA